MCRAETSTKDKGCKVTTNSLLCSRSRGVKANIDLFIKGYKKEAIPKLK